jgi:low affinity Fe/Cu permease
VDRYASRPAAVLLVLAAAVAWVSVSIAAGFPARWETVFQTLVAAVTLAMVFVIQHTQARHQRATQRKLDEILHALPDADNSLITLEHASDEELHATGHEHRRRRQAAFDDQAAAGD